jgi:Tol biopolymer transport system component
MSQADRLDRELTAWFAETAAPSIPDYTDDLLRATAGTRQRPRWTFLSRWLPMSDTTFERAGVPRVPWRAIGLVALLLLALAAAAVLIVGSRPRVPTPAPFGLAANGLVAYSSAGDVWVVDPATGDRRTIITGSEYDADPRWSRDGTRIAFLRGAGVSQRLVFANADGSGIVVAGMDPITGIDSEGITWSPASDAVAFVAEGVVYVVEAADGRVKRLAAPHMDGELFWKPPQGRQLMFVSGSLSAKELVLVDVPTDKVEALPVPDEVTDVQRAAGWTPDGRTFAFLGGTADQDRGGLYLVDLATGSSQIVDVGYAQLSNDGTRVVGLAGDDTQTWLCVAPITGGACEPITEPYLDSWGTYYRWSPDDEWIITVRSDDRSFAFDPDRILQTQPVWAAEGAESWQRTVE